MTDVRNVIVIGSGPAGYTAALYAARANLAPLVLKGLDAGGQLMLTTDVENYPGFADGIMGPELMEQFEKQAARFGAEILPGARHRGRPVSARPFSVKAGDQTWQAETIIVATGASAKWLGVPGEEQLRGRGVSACATCDGFFFRDRELMVVGGGDTAMEEATFLTKFAIEGHDRAPPRRVPRLEDHAGPRAGQPQDRGALERHDRGDPRRGRRHRRRVCATRSPARRARSATDGVFMAIGHTPNTSLFEGQLDLDERLHPGGRSRAPTPACRACSRRATSPTRSTGRRSPRPGRAARRRSTPSGSWRRRLHARGNPGVPRRGCTITASGDPTEAVDADRDEANEGERQRWRTSET